MAIWAWPSTTPGQFSAKKELGSSPDRPVSVREVAGSQGRLDAISGALGVTVSIALVAVFTFFMLLKREDLRNRLIELSGHGHLNLMTQAMDDTSRRVSRYLSLQWLMNTAFGLIIFVVLHVIGLPHALLFGALAGAVVYPLHWRSDLALSPAHSLIGGCFQRMDQDPAHPGHLLLYGISDGEFD